jgi:hypothetical protein
MVSWIGTWVVLVVGLVVLYFAGSVGLFAAVVLAALVAFVLGVATRAIKRVVRRDRSRTDER